MSGFAAEWLALREPADLRARDSRVAEALDTAFEGRGDLRILDLGAGSGNNMVATAPLLPAGQHWILADDDAELLDRAVARAPDGVTAEARRADLSGGLAALLDPAPDLVTASAFFDLCGAAWIDDFAGALAETGAALYAVLSYDGREIWEPPSPHDAAALATFHADQQTDKGLGGPALGPEGHARLVEALIDRGYRITEGWSDWSLDADTDATLIAALAEGTANAISARMDLEAASEWYKARRAASHVTIGHRDLLALPPG